VQLAQNMRDVITSSGARPTVTFPASERHRPGTKLYCLVTLRMSGVERRHIIYVHIIYYVVYTYTAYSFPIRGR